jgi:hypothetical protein
MQDTAKALITIGVLFLLGLLVIRVPLDVVLLLAGIAPATDPERLVHAREARST